MWLTNYDQAVLTGKDATYSAAQVSAMADYFTDTFHKGPPETMRLVPGIPTVSASTVDRDYPPGTVSYNWASMPSCGLDLQVTNTGTSAVQVSSAGVRLSAAAGPNTEQYLLVDPCTVGRQLKGNPCPLQRGGGPGPCGVYSAHVTITSGSAGAVFPGKAAASQMAAQRCPELTISPAMTVELWLDVFSTRNLTVSVVPFLLLSASGGTQRLELPEAAGTIAFANMDQFYCYSFDPPTSKFRLTDRGENAIYRSCI